MSSNFTADDLTRLLAGRTLIYREQVMVLRVRIDSVSVTDDGVRLPSGEPDLAMRAIAQPLPAQGLLYRPTPWTMGSRFSLINITENWVSGGYGGWTVYLSPTVMADVLDAVAGVPFGNTYLQPSGEIGTRTPSPYHVALIDVLRKVPYVERAAVP